MPFINIASLRQTLSESNGDRQENEALGCSWDGTIDVSVRWMPAKHKIAKATESPTASDRRMKSMLQDGQICTSRTHISATLSV